MLVDRDNLAAGLAGLPFFISLVACCAGRGGYVVGGAVRDALLGLPVEDVDLVFPEDPTALARAFAAAHGGHWFWLDQERRQSRVVSAAGGHCPVLDFAPFRATTLELDLFDRDFTINAMALALTADLDKAPLLDPACGLEDLHNGLLRMVSRAAFANDPLRVIKGVRHATALGLRIEECTLGHMQEAAPELCRVAPERVRQEVWKILACEAAPEGLHLLSQSMAGNCLFHSSYSEQSHVLIEALSVIRGCWSELSRPQPVIKAWLAREVEQGLSCETLLLWTILLARLDADLPPRLADDWLLSRRATACVKALAGIDDKTLVELHSVCRRPRAFAWWAHHHRIEPKLLLLALAAVAALQGDTGCGSIDAWVPLVDTLGDHPPAELVDGHWLQRELGLPAGPEISRALEALRNAEISGDVADKEEAQRFLSRICLHRD